MATSPIKLFRGHQMLSTFVVGLLLSSAALGQEASWGEDKDDDAGSGPETAQRTRGSGKTEKVSGFLSSVSSFRSMSQDQEDLFIIWIANPESFKASLRTVDNGSASFDSSLYLFTTDSADVHELSQFTEVFGLLGVQDVDLLGAFLPGEATDTTGAMITEPGYYMLAVSSATRYPAVMLTGLPLPVFDFFVPNEVSGPDGAGGMSGFTEGEGVWEGTPASGFYDIAVDGVGFAFPLRTPENDVWPTNAYVDEGVWPIYTVMASTESQADVTCTSPDGDGRVLYEDLWWSYQPLEPGIVGVSTCDSVDFDSAIAVYELMGLCIGDINSDGSVDVGDFSVLLAQWGSSGPEADLDGDGMVDTTDFSIFLVYFGLCEPDLELVACQDDAPGCTNGTSKVSFSTDGTETFVIRIGGAEAGDRGRGTFRVGYE